jgi:anthranilate phosphoribosyltransferase
MGAALALEVAGEERQPREGVARAAAAIDDGSARRVLDRVSSFTVLTS